MENPQKNVERKWKDFRLIHIFSIHIPQSINRPIHKINPRKRYTVYGYTQVFHIIHIPYYRYYFYYCY